MKIFQRALSLVLSILVLVSALPAVTVSAYSYGEVDGFKYEKKDGVVRIYDYNPYSYSASKTPVIPEEIEGLPVVEISKEAFYSCSGVTEITVPATIKTIKNSAFSYCKDLEKITILADVEELGESILSGNAKLKEVILPATLKSIPRSAFSGCSALEKIVIPEGLISIGVNSFWNCTALKSIKIPASVTDIGDEAFEDCTALESITLPDSVRRIGKDAFVNTAVFTAAKNSGENAVYIGNHLIEENVAVSGKELKVKEGTVSIGGYAFYCSRIEKIELPETLVSISAHAFDNSSVKSLVIPSGVTEIGDYAFKACDFRTVVIPASVEKIGQEAFYSCFYLTDIYYLGTEEQWAKIDMGPRNEISKVTIHYNSVTGPSVPDEIIISENAAIAAYGTPASKLLGCVVVDAAVVGGDGKPVAADAILGTGMKLDVKDGKDIIVAVRGDMDGDSEHTASDARLILRAAVGLDKLNAAQTLAADAEIDNKITSSDARTVLRIAVGLLSSEITNDKHEHTFKTVRTEPTCTADGSEDEVCTVCRFEKNVKVIPKAHDYAPATCSSPQKCKKCGATTGEASGTHSFSNGVCKFCGYAPVIDKTYTVLNDMRRYVSYLSIDADILELKLERYQLTGDMKIIKEMIDTVDDMSGYISKISDYSAKDSKVGNWLDYNLDTIEIPYYTGSASTYRSQVRTFIRKSRYIVRDYNIMANNYGIELVKVSE